MMDATFDRTADASDEPTRAGLIGQLWQRRLTVALTFGITLLLIIGLLTILPVSYVAIGSLIVADREPVVGPTSAAWMQKVGDPADIESTILLVRSPRLARMLIDQPGIDAAVEADCAAAARQLIYKVRAIDCGRSVGDADGKLRWVQEAFSVGAQGRSRVVSVSYRSPSPQVAQIMVNGLLQTFLDDEHAKLRHSRDEAVEWVRERLSQLDTELQHDAAAIEAYRNLHGLVSGIGGTLASERLTQAAQQLNDAKSNQAEAELRMREARGGSSSRQALDSRSIIDLKQQLSQASSLTASAALRYGPQNPMLLAYRQQQADIAARLAAETARVGEAARRNLDAANQRVDQAARDLVTQTDAASQASEAETQIASMVRDLEVKRASYVDLSKRLSQLETERRLLEPNTQLVNMAELPPRPAFPQRAPFLIGGLTLATVLATAAGLLTYRPMQSGPYRPRPDLHAHPDPVANTGIAAAANRQARNRPPKRFSVCRRRLAARLAPTAARGDPHPPRKADARRLRQQAAHAADRLRGGRGRQIVHHHGFGAHGPRLRPARAGDRDVAPHAVSRGSFAWAAQRRAGRLPARRPDRAHPARSASRGGLPPGR